MALSRQQLECLIRRYAYVPNITAGLLSDITDWDTLADMLADTGFNPKPRRLIKARMAVVLKQVTADNCPDWFAELLKHPNKGPVLKTTLNQKIKQLQKELA